MDDEKLLGLLAKLDDRISDLTASFARAEAAHEVHTLVAGMAIQALIATHPDPQAFATLYAAAHEKVLALRPELTAQLDHVGTVHYGLARQIARDESDPQPQ